MDNNLTTKDRIITARVRLQKDNPFFSYLVMGLEIKEDTEKTNTIAVDFKGNLYYNPEFIDDKTNEEIKTLLAHEVMHIALLHLARQSKREHELFNVSCDIVINNLLVNNGFEFGKLKNKGLVPAYAQHNYLKLGDINLNEIDKKTAEEIYNILYKDLPKEKQLKLKGFDDHIFNGDDKEDNEDNERQSEAEIKEICDKWKKRLIEAVTYSKIRGNLPKGIERHIDDILDTKLNWKELLYKYITREIPIDYNYNYPSKRSQAVGVYMPSIKRETVNISIGVDVSGSINQKELTEFLSEVVGIAKSFDSIKINIIFMDTQVNNHYVIENGNIDLILNYKVNGCGGTDFKEIYKYLDNEIPNTRLLIFFTDGYASFPSDEEYKTLWVLTSDGTQEDKIPFGDVVRL